MLKLTTIKPLTDNQIRLRFSDRSSGIFDFSEFVHARTTMTAPLADPEFFKRCFIEAGALAWPNGFDLSAQSLHKRLDDRGSLHRDEKAA